MRTIYLYGEARKRFGKSFTLDVRTLSEAVKALGVQIDGFAQYVRDNDWRCVMGKSRPAGFELDKDQLAFHLGNSDLHLTPVIGGSGGGRGQAIGKIIAGVLLAGVAFFAAPALGATAFGGMTYGNLAMMGVAMAMQGVIQLISAQKKDEEKDDSSSSFSGTPQMASQGRPVPLIYGRTVLFDPPVVSAGVESSDIALEGGGDGK